MAGEDAAAPLSEEEIAKLAKAAQESDDAVEALCALPEQAREALGTMKIVMKVFSESTEEAEQEQLLDAFPMVKDNVLPEALKLCKDKLIKWWTDYETQSTSEDDRVKLLIEHLKEIYNSPLVKYAKDTSDMDLKVAFFFALGSCVSLVKRKDGPKWLKKKPLLQTWCDRVITTFFPRYDIPDDTEDKLREKTEKLIERAGGSVVDVWLKSRKTRSFQMWMTALRRLTKVDEHRAQLTVNFLQCFEAKTVNQGPKVIYDARPGSIKLIMSERNPCFKAFHELARKAPEVKELHHQYLQKLPAYSLDIAEFVKQILKSLGKSVDDFFSTETDDSSAKYLSLTEKGREKLRDVQMKLRGGAATPGAGPNMPAAMPLPPMPLPSFSAPARREQRWQEHAARRNASAARDAGVSAAVAAGPGGNKYHGGGKYNEGGNKQAGKGKGAKWPPAAVEFYLQNMGTMSMADFHKRSWAEQEEIVAEIQARAGGGAPGKGAGKSSSSWKGPNIKGGPVVGSAGNATGATSSSSSSLPPDEKTLKLAIEMKTVVTQLMANNDREAVETLKNQLQGKGYDLLELIKIAGDAGQNAKGPVPADIRPGGEWENAYRQVASKKGGKAGALITRLLDKGKDKNQMFEAWEQLKKHLNADGSGLSVSSGPTGGGDGEPDPKRPKFDDVTSLANLVDFALSRQDFNRHLLHRATRCCSINRFSRSAARLLEKRDAHYDRPQPPQLE
eukprot:CAMPEP_0178995596 /NCGR_PEP_ID=MMETSP0795-20121207/7907_1 /TAXON_ID=88552 /ORGANISM="Amoebophrya sp., Strain Ameob2" /LENGTH=728 /DNA_ID=CAMNT_0020687905 /DNA_START=482 /DNA_END=2667 /DNA_ORIENTATION=-